MIWSLTRNCCSTFYRLASRLTFASAANSPHVPAELGHGAAAATHLVDAEEPCCR
jgi:hypothetical protein